MQRKNTNKGIIATAFAVGMLLSCFCPSEFIIALLALAVIILGLSCARCR